MPLEANSGSRVASHIVLQQGGVGVSGRVGFRDLDLVASAGGVLMRVGGRITAREDVRRCPSPQFTIHWVTVAGLLPG